MENKLGNKRSLVLGHNHIGREQGGGGMVSQFFCRLKLLIIEGIWAKRLSRHWIQQLLTGDLLYARHCVWEIQWRASKRPTIVVMELTVLWESESQQKVTNRHIIINCCKRCKTEEKGVMRQYTRGPRLSWRFHEPS